MSIYMSDPFATPEADRSPVRRLRGRLPAGVALYTAYGADSRPAGLTVSSTVLVEGDPARLIAVLDPESDLLAAAGHQGRFAVGVLGAAHARLADQFAGLLPAPGGAFAGQPWRETEFGPVPEGVAGWAGCRLDDTRTVGFGMLVEATVAHVEINRDQITPLVRFRGRYGLNSAG